MTVTVRDMPVVVIVILGKRVTVDGEAIYHDGSRPLGEVAADAVAELFARPLGRPVRAVASDQAGTCTLVVHPNGSWSNVVPVTSTESEHFPEFGEATLGAVAPSMPGVATSHVRVDSTEEPVAATSRRRWVAALAVAVLLVLAASVVGRLSRDEPVAQASEPPPPSASPSASPEATVTPPASEAPEPTKITGVARQSPGGPVRLTIRSSVAPLSVDVILLARGGQPVRRTVLIPNTDARDAGTSVQVFSKLSPQVYRWRVLAQGKKVVTGTVRVRAAEVVEPSPPVEVPWTPTVTPPDSNQPSRPPPSGPRGNEPIPPKPQP